MKIGLFTKDSESFFTNGCNQQAIFLYETFNNIKDVDCYLITIKTTNILNYKIISIENSNSTKELLNLDIIINVSYKISTESELKIYKDNFVKIIDYNCGNIFYIYQEDLIFDTHHYIQDFNYYKYYDEMWSIPNYGKDKYFYESLYNINHRTAPYIWNSTLINTYKGLTYDPSIEKQKTKYILICEPNQQITKTCLKPLIMCERLYNNGYKNIKILLLSRLKTKSFTNLVTSLNIYKDLKLELYDRLPYFDLIKQLKDQKLDFFIVSHHQDNPLNFLHLETLYLNYPLIHNCKEYKNAGYYYNNIKEGEQQLLYAMNNHIHNLDSYKLESEKTLFKYSPNNPMNISLYKYLLDKVTNRIYFTSNITDNSTFLWKEIKTPIYTTLKKKGYNVLDLYVDKNTEYIDNNVYVIFGIHLFETLPKKYIVYQSEQLEARKNVISDDVFNNYIKVLSNALEVWDYSKKNVIFIRENYKNITIKYVPIFSNVIHEDTIKDIKDIDISWFGNIALRREKYFKDVANKIHPEYNINTYNNTWLEEKQRVLLKTKIVIDISINNPQLSNIPIFRYKDAFENKCLIIAERTGDDYMNSILEHYVVFVSNADEMANKIKYYLKNEYLRLKMVNNAYKWWNQQNSKELIKHMDNFINFYL